jgi:hypothetical protein
VIAASPDLLAGLPLAQACALLEVGRGDYYRTAPEADQGRPVGRPEVKDLELWAALEVVVLAYPRCGYHYATQQLRRKGFQGVRSRILATNRRRR